jgi:hypothetical protein
MITTVCKTFQQEPSPPPLSGTHVTNIHYVSSSFSEQMRSPCALYDSLYHFTYLFPLIVLYRGHHSTPIESHPNTSPLVLPSLYTVKITSPKPQSLPNPPWLRDILSEDILPNPPNALVHFPHEILPLTTVYHPQCLDIWFMSSDPSCPVCDISSPSFPLEDNHTLTVARITSSDALYSHIFLCVEDIL